MGIDNSLFLGYTVAFRCTFTTREVKTMEWIVAILAVSVFAFVNIKSENMESTGSGHQRIRYVKWQIWATIVNFIMLMFITTINPLAYKGVMLENWETPVQWIIFFLLLCLAFWAFVSSSVRYWKHRPASKAQAQEMTNDA